MQDPLRIFEEWYHAAIVSGIREPGAVILSTVSESGRPSSRVVLLKEHGIAGFVFYTNYGSRKGKELLLNPWAALLFYWRDQGRQIRIEGPVSKIPESESDDYFATRPRGSQIGAHASRQSEEIPTLQHLRNLVGSKNEEFANKEIPRPPNWGGYSLLPVNIEFWKEGDDRLHERILFRRENGKWIKSLLSP